MYRDATTQDLVTVVVRLNHCGVIVRTTEGTEYTTCFCSLLAL